MGTEIGEAKFFGESVPSCAQKLIPPGRVGTQLFAVALAASHFSGMVAETDKCGACVLGAIAVGASGAFGGGDGVEKGVN